MEVIRSIMKTKVKDVVLICTYHPLGSYVDVHRGLRLELFNGDIVYSDTGEGWRYNGVYPCYTYLDMIGRMLKEGLILTVTYEEIE